MKLHTLAISLFTISSTFAFMGCTHLTPTTDQTQSASTSTTQSPTNPTLTFDPNTYQSITITEGDIALAVRAYENIPYVARPTEPDYQLMNIYIPEAYFQGNAIMGYTAETAPIFFPNAIGGYMPAKPLSPQTSQTTQTDKPARKTVDSVSQALMQGYVVASSGARGRTLQTDGTYTGKAPAAIIDLKAAVRYLHANDTIMAGNANKIISSGTSAGGGLSVLLGATANHQDYAKELAAIGAANASDAVFAVSAYAPITNLDNADTAYEWQFNGINDYKKMSITMLDYHVERKLIENTLSDTEIAHSDKLKAHFPAYINSLGLIGKNGQLLTLDEQGNGTFKDAVLYHLNQSANRAAQAGTDLSSHDWLSQHKSKNPYYISDYEAFIQSYVGRGKGVPAFDATDLSSGENNLFGNHTTDNRHFTTFGQQNSTVQNAQSAEPATIRMMNPLPYLDNTPTQYWRIRHGAKDADTGFAIPVILATSLENQGKTVDFAMPWGQGHGGDYDLPELFAWINAIAKP